MSSPATKIKVSDYIAKFLLKNSVNTIFTITGGFSMHMTDSFGKNSEFRNIFQHHEQACAYSAVGYAKTNANPCAVCTTAGCAATNAITPCLVAYQDSLPILFLSGQVKSEETIRHMKNDEGIHLRHYSGADCDIISMVSGITKYAHEVQPRDDIKQVLKRAFTEMLFGRPGPVWLSIPLDIQGTMIDYEDIPIICKIPQPYPSYEKLNMVESVVELLEKSQRPVIVAGNGIKLAHCEEKFRDFIEKYSIPVLVSFHGTDLIESDHPLFCGKIGLIGDRVGNFTLQNADLVLSLGCRMAQGVVGYRPDWFAREAKKIYIDNDCNELLKNNLVYDLRICMDLSYVFEVFEKEYKKRLDLEDTDNWNFPPAASLVSVTPKIHTGFPKPTQWINTCNRWKQKWMYEMPPNYLDDSAGINPYLSLRTFFDMAPENKITIVSSGSIITNVWHMISIKKNDKYVISSQGDMGFELTAAIGAAIAQNDKMIVPILGEGSLQLNIQELQTIVHHALPIKILVFNNGTHGATKMTQTNFFQNLYGVNAETGISFPDTEKICFAYGIKYIGIRKNDELVHGISEFLAYSGPVLCEIFSCIQSRFPRLNAVKNDDGTFSNRPFEDMDPFMSREEFEKEMIVKIV
jgi:acetolactate synthase-1/2/3 large subunit